MPRYDAVDESDANASGLARAGGFVFEAVRCMVQFVWIIFLATVIGLVVVILAGWIIGAVKNLLGWDRD